jgi:hypothetical protein
MYAVLKNIKLATGVVVSVLPLYTRCNSMSINDYYATDEKLSFTSALFHSIHITVTKLTS